MCAFRQADKPESSISIGNRGEDIAAEFLTRKGFEILARNVDTKFAEIDIIARKGRMICFVEVRTRANAILGHPAETINLRKQKQVRRAAEYYLARSHLSGVEVRFDAITITWDDMQLLHFENAF